MADKKTVLRIARFIIIEHIEHTESDSEIESDTEFIKLQIEIPQQETLIVVSESCMSIPSIPDAFSSFAVTNGERIDPSVPCETN